MAIFDTQKVDYLWKKLGYGRSKTDIVSLKNATNESIASPLFLRGDIIWSQSDLIPDVIPVSTSGVVEVYSTTLPVECVADITASPNRTWKTNIIDWIPPEIGATYNVKVYVHTSGQASNAASSGEQLFAAGSGNDDEWFFDYQSGVLHFIGDNLPNGIDFSGKSVYVSGAVYTGIKGVPAPGAAITFTSVGIGSHLTVTGFSTFTNTSDFNNGVYIDNIQIGITDDNEIDTTVGNLVIDSAEGQVTIDDRLIVTGISTFNSDVDIDANLNVDSTLIVTGIATFSNNIDANGDLDVDGFTELDSTNISETLNVVGVSTFGSDVDVNANVDISGYLDVDGFTELDAVNISETLNVVGVSTFASAVDINADLDVDGFTELDSTNISETLNVVGVSTFGSAVDINADLDVDGFTELDSTNISETLNVVGLSTFGSAVDINADLDVDGFTELDSTNISETLNVVGLSTFGSAVDINADLDVDGFTELDSTNISETLNVVGVSTFGSDVDINANVDISGYLDVDGYTELDSTNISETLNVVGISTFASAVDINADLDVDGFTELDSTNISETLNVVGVSTFASAVDINADLDVDGFTELDSTNISETLNVVGVSTFGSDVDINASVDISADLTVDGYTDLDITNISETLNVVGVSTFGSDVDVNANVDISGYLNVTGDGHDINGTIALDNVNVSGIVTATQFHTGTEGTFIRVTSDSITGPSTITIDPAGVGDITGLVIIKGDLQVDGTQTIINSTSVTVDDLNIMLADGAANDAAADGGGITVQSGEGNKTFQFESTGDNFGSSENLNLATGKTYKIANTEVLSSTQLTVANISSSGIGTIEILDTTTGTIDYLSATNINLSGVSTFAAAVDINSDLDVDGFTELDSTNISETLNVVGISTFESAVDINADLDVDGFTELDSVNVSETLNVVGVSTFGSDVDINANVDISGYLDVDGFTELDSTNISETLNVVGLTTFGSAVDVNADLDVDGFTELDSTNISETLNVVGVSTFGSAVDVNADLDVDGFTELDSTNISETLNVVGLSTFASNVDINADLDVDGYTELDSTNISETLNVVGLSTFASNVDINADLDVDGFTELDSTNISETLNVVGLTTLGSDVDINASVDISGELVVDGLTDLDELNVVGVSTFGSDVDVNANVDISGNLDVHTDLDVDGFTELDSTNISETLNVVGLTTLGSNVDINASVDISTDLTVDGYTDLDVTNISETLNVVGLTTFGSAVDINADLDVDGFTELDSTNISETLNVVGVSTFGSDVDINANVDISGYLDVDGFTELDSTNISETLNVVGVSTFGSDIDVNANVDISGNLVVHTDLDVDGFAELDSTNISETLNVVGLTTLGSNVDINASVDISADLTVDGSTDLDELNVTGLSTFTSNVDINASLDISNDLVVNGDARVVGVLTVGPASVTIDGTNNTVTVGTGVTIYEDSIGIGTITINEQAISTLYELTGDNANFAGGVNVTGIITATKFDGNLNALGKTYYVATTGSDSNSGDNINEPFLTIEYALSVATNGDIVNISAGVYEETCPLTVPRGVTVKGAGLRATTIRPTTATQQENIFLLNDISTVEDFTIRGSYFDSTADTGYAFSYATGIAITTRSPYVQRVTVLNTGSIVSASDPYGYDTADSPPTSYVAGAGAKVDGSLVAGNSLEAGMLFNEVTFFTPNNKGIVLTNGARAEYLNCFHYFASQAIVGVAGTLGIGGNADARLKLSGITTTPVVNDVVKLFEGGVGIATGTITSYSNDYATIDGLGIGTFTSVGIGSTQDVRFYQSDGVTQTGIASAILLADYTMFGAEMRSVGCAVEYGSQGVVADGNGVKLRMFATNFNHVGSGKDFTNDDTLTVQANEVIELSGGQVSYVSIDQSGDFRVGDALYINQETGNVSFAATSYSLEVTGELDVTDGTNTSTLAPTSLTVGGLQLAANTLSSVSGNIIIDPAGSNKTIVQGDLGVVGILTAQVLTADALQKGDTAISISDTGSDGTIIFTTDNTEAFRINNSQVTVFTGAIDANGDLDVDGHAELDNVNVSGLSTFVGLLDANGGINVTGTTETDQLNVSGVSTFTGLLDANGGLDVLGYAELDDVNVSGVSTFTGAIDANGGLDVLGYTELDDVNVSGLSTFTGLLDANGGLDVTGQTTLNNDLAVVGLSTFTGLLDANGGLDVTGQTTLNNDLAVVGLSTFTGAIDANGGLDVFGYTELDDVNVSGIITATSVVFGSGTAITSVDTDLSSASESDDTLASAKAIKSYVDSQVTAQDLDFAGDIGTGAVDLDSQTFTIAGTVNEIETSASGQTITVGLPGVVAITTSLTVGSTTVIDGSGIIAGIVTATLDNALTLSTSGVGLSGSATYDNSGAATFTVTSNATDANTSSTIVSRDASGNFSAGNITADLVGTATTATNLADGANITTGTISDDRLPDLITSNINITSGISTFNSIGVSTVTSQHYDTAQTRIGSSTLTTNDTAPVSALDLDAAVFRSAEILIQSSESTNMHLSKLLVIHDGTNAYLTEYGTIYNTAVNATFDVIISGGNIQLIVTPSSGSTIEFKVNYTAIRI